MSGPARGLSPGLAPEDAVAQERPLPPALLRAGYRPFFLAGAVYAVLAVGLWFAWTEAGRLGAGIALPWRVPPPALHALTMIFGVVTFYAFGFLLTAFPRWIEAPAPTPRRVVSLLVGVASGQALLIAGSFAGPGLLIAGGVVEGAAMLWLVATLGRGLTRARGVRKAQPAAVLAALALGAAGLGLSVAGLVSGSRPLYTSGLLTGVYGYLLVLTLGVGQRIIPFFTALALGRPYTPRPPGVLFAVLALALLRVALGAVAAAGGAGTIATGVTAAADLVLALVLLGELAAWRPGPGFRSPMLAVLYLGIGWLALGPAFDAFLRLSSGPAAIYTPAAHALAVGGFATMVLGMSTRVALGHAGRPIAAGGLALLIFASIQAAAVLRAALPLAPGTAGLAHYAALPWILAFGVWLLRYGRLLFAGAPGRSA